MPNPARVLVVCTANVCRSPMGEALLRRVARDHLPKGALEVTSVGVSASPGRPAADETVEIAGRWGVELSGHRARIATADEIRAANLVLTMEERHRTKVLRLVPSALGRTFTWLEFARLVEGEDASRGSRGLVAHLEAVTREAQRARPVRPGPSAPENVPDPIGKPMDVYQEVAQLLVDSASTFLPIALRPSGR